MSWGWGGDGVGRREREVVAREDELVPLFWRNDPTISSYELR